MLANRKKRKNTKIDTLIGHQSEMRGDVLFNGGLHVDGTIRGNVIADPESGSVLSLSERGVIEGEVRVPNVILNGTVIGDVYSSNQVDLAAQARVSGNVYYNLIEMERGAEVNGNLVHDTEKVAAKRSELPAKEEADKSDIEAEIVNS